MKRLTLVLLLAVCGCGALRSGVETAGQILGVKRSSPPVAPKPVQPPAMQEALREVLAGAVAVAVEVQHEGAKPHDPDVAEQRAGLQAMQAPIGVPVRAPATLAERKASRADLEGESGKQRKREAEWEAGQATAARKSGETGWSLHSGALGTYILMGAGASLAAIAWRALRKAAAGAGRFNVLSGAVETLKATNPTAAEPLLTILRAESKAVQDDLSANRIKAGG